MSILIRSVQIGETETTGNVLIDGTRFASFDADPHVPADTVLDGSGKALLPPFYNAHTHAAMSLMRGYADDIELHTWLQDHIWPLEAKLTEEDVYHGARLACLEMIRSGTVFFNDMYWHYHGTARAVEEMGLRADLSGVLIDVGADETKSQAQRDLAEQLFEETGRYGPRVRFALGPHAIYTVSEENLRWCADFANRRDIRIHLHLSETRKEVEECVAAHGCRPVEYLDRLGVLNSRLVIAHAIWVNEDEMALLAAHGVTVVHCPKSNMKLCSGEFAYSAMKAHGVRVTLGTDGCSSNNNLDMLEEAKFASLRAKNHDADPTAGPAPEVFSLATRHGAEAFGLDAGRLEAGALADCILVDLDNARLVPGYHLLSDMVYSADSSCIDTVICDGRVLMRAGVIDAETQIIAQARRTCTQLLQR